MPEIKSRLAFEPLRSQAIGVAYANLGTAMANTIRMFKIVNDTTAGVTVSYDGGTTDHEYLPAGSFVLIDVASNRVWNAELVMRKGLQVAVKGTGAGNVYLSTYYAD